MDIVSTAAESTTTTKSATTIAAAAAAVAAELISITIERQRSMVVVDMAVVDYLLYMCEMPYVYDICVYYCNYVCVPLRCRFIVTRPQLLSLSLSRFRCARCTVSLLTDSCVDSGVHM